MALHTKKLYYRRGSTTEQIDLYTTTAEVGSEYIALRDGSTSVYAPIGVTTDSRASLLRVMKDSIKAVLKQLIVYVGIWSGAGSGMRGSPGQGWSTTTTFSFDYNRVFSSSNLNNFKAEIGGYSSIGYNRVRVDGTTYSTPRSFRLSTGNHTVSYEGIQDDEGSNGYSIGYRIV